MKDATHLTCLSGRIKFTPEADEWHDSWHRSLVSPEDDILHPFFDRMDDLVIKFSMCLAVADGFRMHITVQDLKDAIALCDWILEILPLLLEYSHRTQDTELLAWLCDYIKSRKGWVLHSMVLRRASGRGANASRFAELMRTLIERGDVKTDWNDKGGRIYCHWMNLKKEESK